ncbi:hypothetical protein OIM90_00460 [Streptomyces sp. AD16]|nr:hypothetical protein OIM90_00460 [Streptomyces sp. AD16]
MPSSSPPASAPSQTGPQDAGDDGLIKVRDASEHNLRHVDVDVPRDRVVAFTGVSGSGKSSLAFATLYAEAQQRYLESVAPYARRLIDQGSAPKVGSITGLPPAVALRQQHGGGSTRSTVGTVSRVSNVLRMLYSRAGTYPRGRTPRTWRGPSRATRHPWTPTASRRTRRSAPARPARAWDACTASTTPSWWATTR